jgi:hypothetical protein
LSHRILRPLLFPILSVATITGTLLTVCHVSAHAQGGVPVWTNRYDGPGQGNDFANAIALDGSGNVFVTGSSCTDCPETIGATIKYSNAGVPLWTNRYQGPGGHDSPNAIALDGSGYVFVTGFSCTENCLNTIGATVKYSSAGVPLWTNSHLFGASAIAVDSVGNVIVAGTDFTDALGDYGTIAYSSTGLPLWTNTYAGENGYDRLIALAVDGNGNVFVTGYSDPGDQVTIKYSGEGVPLWTNHYGQAYPTAIAVDSSGNVFVTGGTGVGTLNDYATVAYSNSGEPLWTNRYNGPANHYDLALAIAVDRRGNIFVTGLSPSAIGANDYATIAYSNSGVPLWTNRYNGPANSEDSAKAIAVDSNGNVFVTGHSYNGQDRVSSDYVTIAYSSVGVPLWTNRYNGPAKGEDAAEAIAVDSSGNVFVTGHSWNGTNYDYVTIEYSSSVPPPRLDFQLLSNQLVLSWTNAGFNLQSAPVITGTFTNILSATSPYTNSFTALQQFFRLKGE